MGCGIAIIEDGSIWVETYLNYDNDCWPGTKLRTPKL
jgi:hypothetical protein